jgi:hypothetical protein
MCLTGALRVPCPATAFAAQAPYDQQEYQRYDNDTQRSPRGAVEVLFVFPDTISCCGVSRHDEECSRKMVFECVVMYGTDDSMIFMPKDRTGVCVSSTRQCTRSRKGIVARIAFPCSLSRSLSDIHK